MLALRNTKINRDIAITCNRFYGKTDVTSYRNQAKENATGTVQFNQFNDFRYNTTKPTIFPKIDFPPRESKRALLSEMTHLQPARQSKFISVSQDYNPLKEPQKENQPNALMMECPFPRPIIEPQQHAIAYSERTKLKSMAFNRYAKLQTRNYSTIPGNSPFLIVARGFASPKSNNEKCDDKKKKPCRRDTGCPRFTPRDCKASKGSDCNHYYIDPKCKKKMAPYKSYSETCHEILQDDPSECFQCPWEKCRGIENIKPPKRGYHTWRQYCTCKEPPCEVATIPISSPSIPFFPIMQLDAKKKPCKRPPPKCGKKEKKKKCPPPKPTGKKKKCMDDNYWTEPYGLWCARRSFIPSSPWIIPGCLSNAPPICDISPQKKKPCKVPPMPCGKKKRCPPLIKRPKKKCLEDDYWNEPYGLWCERNFIPSSWITPDCLSNAPPIWDIGPQLLTVTHPADCKCNNCNHQCTSNLMQGIAYSLLDPNWPKQKGKCPPLDMPGPPTVDRSIDIEIHAIKEHDKGHPPPCTEKRRQSKQCPKEENRTLPYKKQRDLLRPEYRRHPEPYSDDQGTGTKK